MYVGSECVSWVFTCNANVKEYQNAFVQNQTDENECKHTECCPIFLDPIDFHCMDKNSRQNVFLCVLRKSYRF